MNQPVMSRLVALCLVVGAAAVVLGAARLSGPTPGAVVTPATQPPAESAPPVPLGRVIGTAGCASAACHGGPASAALEGRDDSRRWACAATFYLARDPHTKAFAALESPLADEIMARMKRPGKATEDVRCVACHTNPSLATATDPHEVALRRDGVGCEACHGNASAWLHEHATWTAATRAEGYKRTGMTKLYDLGERALTCAGCHVGAPADPPRGYPVRDMNHDMIAAGHPRLNFDFADYQQNLPPHWAEKNRDTGEPRDADFQVKAWLVGRVAHAEAACRLLADRATRAAATDARTPWPEFAEWSCVSCHHPIKPGDPENKVWGRAGPGVPPWQPIWPVTTPSDFAALKSLGPVGMADLFKVIETPRPTIAGVEPAAVAAVRALAKVRAALVGAPAPDVSAVLRAPAVRVGSLDRDAAGQLYHGLAAFERMRIRRAGAQKQTVDLPVPPAFALVHDKLRSPRDDRSPEGYLRFDVPQPARDALAELMNRAK